jgi:predicted metalloprotease with PDZ domain
LGLLAPWATPKSASSTPNRRQAGEYLIITAVHRTDHIFQLGFARASLSDGGVIRDLASDSAAARAGIKEGDQVVTVKGLVEARKYEARSLSVTLRRADQQIEVTYVPRGAEVAGYGWVRNRAAGEQTCKF